MHVVHMIGAALAGVAFGVFCPALARKLKGLFSKGVAKVEADIKAKV